MGGVRPLVVVEVDPAPDAGLGLRSGFPGVEVDALVFQGPPEALYEDIVQASALAENERRKQLAVTSPPRFL